MPTRTTWTAVLAAVLLFAGCPEPADDDAADDDGADDDGADDDAGDDDGADDDAGDDDGADDDSGDDDSTPETDPHVSGEQRRWHTLTFSFDGPAAAETDESPNPFLDYRLWLHLEAPSGASWTVPGFFAGDGAGGDSGSVWAARFTPDETGTWSYEVDFRGGAEVALDLDPGAGTEEAPDGTTGSFGVIESDESDPDLRARGRIEYTGGHYLHTADGQVWIKGGADSPENFLGYAGFDNTVDQSGGAGTSGLQDGVHRYEPHLGDWAAGDPEWGSGEGHGIIGALNYLSSAGVNSIYFLPCNLGGDGRETYPYVAPDDLEHLDLSKLHQWEIVLAHAEQHGIALHFVLSETESGNENLHDNGTLGPQRKLFYRELAARFGHHLGVFWNIGEENDYGDARQKEFAAYLRAQDPYDHPTTVHTHANDPHGQYDDLLGDPNFELTSIQLSPQNAEQYSEEWWQLSEDSGRTWVVMLDEIGPAGTGVTDGNAPDIRRWTLWPGLLGGAGGVEWYFGYHDLPLGGDMRCEDFRTREEMWTYTRLARAFLEPLPLDQMAPRNDLLAAAGEVMLAQPGSVYALYLEDGDPDAELDLSDAGGSCTLTWYDVRTGTWSTPATLQGGGSVVLGTPAFSDDVAGLVTCP